ncbi:organic cation transporter protein-like [Branchiostoma floridae]|uniref:Organic cation transporter protein-like n=1 Tax=Branchiostoma floridae TaxID=7739 RepID=A0A9J7MY09_BRAFL|nr:organic cation transporter protein-like [Branchiostoma floridae]
MEWDDVLNKYLGEFGRFQRFTSLLAILVGPTVGLTLVAMTFLAATPEHHCRVFGNTSSVGHRYSTEGHNLSIPLENIGGTWKYSSCLMYKNLNRTESSRNETIACTHGWEYDRTIYQSTIVTEYDLVCRRSWLKGLGQSTSMVGVSVGGIFFGITSDRFGRRPTTVFCLILHLALSTGASFASDYVSFIVLRALDGAAANGAFFTAFVLGTVDDKSFTLLPSLDMLYFQCILLLFVCLFFPSSYAGYMQKPNFLSGSSLTALEVVGSSKRNAVGMTASLSFGTGFFVLSVLAYFLRTWRNLQLVQALMMYPLLCYWWVLPESPRWLLSKQRVTAAKEVLQRAARMNKVTLTDEVSDLLVKSAESNEITKSFTIIDLVRTPRMRKITLTMCLVWMFIAGVYFGLIVGTTGLAGDPYVNFTIGTALEIVLAILGWAGMERWGRKPVIAGSALMAGIGCLVSAAAIGLPTVSRNFALMGRAVIGITYNCLIAYSPEVFPTVVRSMGIGVATAFSRIGSILSPFVTLLGDVWLPLPMVTFGVAACAGGLAVFLLQETLGVPLPETIEDVENLGRKSQRDDDHDKSVSYTNPWPKRDPFRHVKRVVTCYQTARDGGYFNSILVP